MISEPKSPAETRALHWAAEQLGVEPGSPPEMCTEALLQRLAEEDFVPPARLRIAWEVAARRSPENPPALPWLESAAEEDLGDRVEQFAGRFFVLTPEQRLLEWRQFADQARQWPRLQTRLRQLKAGLMVDFAPQPGLGERETRLIEWARELFPLPPDRRAERRRQLWREGLGDDIRPWQEAARRVEALQPAIAAAARDLLAPLATWSQQVEAAAKNRRSHSVTVVRSRPGRTRGGSPWSELGLLSRIAQVRSVLLETCRRWLWVVPLFGAIVLAISVLSRAGQEPPIYDPINTPSWSPEQEEVIERAAKLLSKRPAATESDWRDFGRPLANPKPQPPPKQPVGPTR